MRSGDKDGLNSGKPAGAVVVCSAYVSAVQGTLRVAVFRERTDDIVDSHEDSSRRDIFKNFQLKNREMTTCISVDSHVLR